MTYAEFETPSGYRVLIDQKSDDVGYERPSLDRSMRASKVKCH
jgi:hypothetical protein